MQLDKNLYQHPKLITIFGGSGFIGRHLTQKLIQNNFRVRIAVRYPAKAYAMQQLKNIDKLEFIATNIISKTEIEKALENSDAAINLAGSWQNNRKNNFNDLYIKGPCNIAQITKGLNLPLIHISALNDKKNTKSTFYQTKAEGEQKLLNLYEKATILRPSLIYGPGDHFFTQQAKIATSWPFFPLFGPEDVQFQPLYIGHLTDFIHNLLQQQNLHGQIYELGGQEILSYKKMSTILLKAICRQKKIKKLPSPLTCSLSTLSELCAKIPLMPKCIRSEDIKILRCNSIVSNGMIGQIGPLDNLFTQKTTLSAILPSYLWYYRPKGQFNDR